MTPNLCTFCGSRHSDGHLLNDSTLRICRVCRDRVLTWISRCDFLMTDAHPLIQELCEDSHYIISAAWSFYNSDTEENQHIIRVVK